MAAYVIPPRLPLFHIGVYMHASMHAEKTGVPYFIRLQAYSYVYCLPLMMCVAQSGYWIFNSLGMTGPTQGPLTNPLFSQHAPLREFSG